MAFDSTALPEPDQAEELFISFGNTLEYERGQPADAVPDITSLLGWLRERRLISGRGLAAEAARLRRDPDETARRVERFHHLRKVLHGIALEVTENGHPTGEQLRDLNHILRHGLHYHQIERDPTEPGTPSRRSAIASTRPEPRSPSSLAQFLADDAPSRLRVCANVGCRYLLHRSLADGATQVVRHAHLWQLQGRSRGTAPALGTRTMRHPRTPPEGFRRARARARIRRTRRAARAKPVEAWSTQRGVARSRWMPVPIAESARARGRGPGRG